MIEGLAKDLRPFLFKIGTANLCSDRIASLNQFRRRVVSKDDVTFSEPAYAGATDWKILRCWPVDTGRYDDRVFKRWLARNHDERDVKSVGATTFSNIEGLDPQRSFLDLCMMSEDYVRRRSGVRVNDPLHERMLSAVVEALVFLGDDFIADGVTDRNKG